MKSAFMFVIEIYQQIFDGLSDFSFPPRIKVLATATTSCQQPHRAWLQTPLLLIQLLA